MAQSDHAWATQVSGDERNDAPHCFTAMPSTKALVAPWPSNRRRPCRANASYASSVSRAPLRRAATLKLALEGVAVAEGLLDLRTESAVHAPIHASIHARAAFATCGSSAGTESSRAVRTSGFTTPRCSNALQYSRSFSRPATALRPRGRAGRAARGTTPSRRTSRACRIGQVAPATRLPSAPWLKRRPARSTRRCRGTSTLHRWNHRSGWPVAPRRRLARPHRLSPIVSLRSATLLPCCHARPGCRSAAVS